MENIEGNSDSNELQQQTVKASKCVYVSEFELQTDMQEAAESLVRLLESYRGRDKVVSSLS